MTDRTAARVRRIADRTLKNRLPRRSNRRRTAAGGGVGGLGAGPTTMRPPLASSNDL
jgi:hypothetical protein